VAELFNTQEFYGVVKVLRDNGVEIDVVSGQTYIQDQGSDDQIKLKITYDTLDLSTVAQKYDGVICVGGASKPSRAMWKNKKIRTIVKEMNAHGKLCAGICAFATASIADAMNGKKVAIYPNTRAMDWCKMHGAILTGKPLESDQNVVTSASEQYATQWGELIVKKLKELKK